MLARIFSCAVIGLEGVIVDVEVDYSSGMGGVIIVGLPDAAVQESRERVQSAIKNAGLPFPRKRVIVNLAPALVRKEGSYYDLPIALGVLVMTGLLPHQAVENTLVVGLMAVHLHGDWLLGLMLSGADVQHPQFFPLAMQSIGDSPLLGQGIRSSLAGRSIDSTINPGSIGEFTIPLVRIRGFPIPQLNNSLGMIPVIVPGDYFGIPKFTGGINLNDFR